MDYHSISLIASLPGNPFVAVLPFLPASQDVSSPCIGRMIAEVFTMSLWQHPSLNLYHPWLLQKDQLHIVCKGLSVEKYAMQVAQHNAARIVITGTYQHSRGKLWVSSTAFRKTIRGTMELLGTYQAEGCLNRLIEWGGRLPFVLLHNSFTEIPWGDFGKQTLIDAPLNALELACAAIDCAAFRDGADAAHHYIRKALQIAPDSVYLRFTSTLVGMERRRVPFCNQLLTDNPSFVPAYFPDQSAFSEDVEELQIAREMYLNGLSFVPFNAHSYYGLRQICIRLGDAKSLIPFAKLHTIRGTFSTDKNPFGDTFATCIEEAVEQGQYDVAREIFEAGMSMAEDPLARSLLLKARGWCEQQAGNLQEALAFFLGALRERPSVRLREDIANVYYYQGRYPEAASIYFDLLCRRLSRDSMLSVKYRFARCLEHLGRSEEAITIYKEICTAKISSVVALTIVQDAYDRLRVLATDASEALDCASDSARRRENS